MRLRFFLSALMFCASGVAAPAPRWVQDLDEPAQRYLPLGPLPGSWVLSVMNSPADTGQASFVTERLISSSRTLLVAECHWYELQTDAPQSLRRTSFITRYDQSRSMPISEFALNSGTLHHTPSKWLQGLDALCEFKTSDAEIRSVSLSSPLNIRVPELGNRLVRFVLQHVCMDNSTSPMKARSAQGLHFPARPGKLVSGDI